jgi:muconolactone delta-isomerase
MRPFSDEFDRCQVDERWTVAVYMVERDLPTASVERLRAAQRAISLAARRLAAEGKPIRYIRCIFVPGEARSICLFDSPTAELVREVNEEAGVPFVRILPAIDVVPPSHCEDI